MVWSVSTMWGYVQYLNIEFIRGHVYDFVPIDSLQCCCVNSSDLHHAVATNIGDYFIASVVKRAGMMRKYDSFSSIKLSY
jgi:hypothetical protein